MADARQLPGRRDAIPFHPLQQRLGVNNDVLQSLPPMSNGSIHNGFSTFAASACDRHRAERRLHTHYSYTSEAVGAPSAGRFFLARAGIHRLALIHRFASQS